MGTVIWLYSAECIMRFGKNTPWGVYTEKASDAYNLAFILGDYAEPVHDTLVLPGNYLHYHVANRIFRDYFNHFHVWYGSPA